MIDSSSSTGIDAANSEVLRAIYLELYAYNRMLRDRLIRITSGILAVFVIADGWIISISNGTGVGAKAKVAIGLGISLLALITASAIYSHYREYLANAHRIVRVERALGVYEEGFYLEADTLFSSSNQQWGSGKHSRHMLLAPCGSILLFAICSAILIMIV